MCSIIECEASYATRQLVQGDAKLEHLQGRVRALEDLHGKLLSEWTFLHAKEAFE